ncbi:MAG: ATP-grasp domain-containing protein [Candidatus Bathyarchaeota archaeon]
MKKQDRTLTGLKVGILYNSPVMPSKGEDVDYVADAEVEEEVEAVEDALERLDLEYQQFPLKENVENLVQALKRYQPDVVVNLCEAAFGDSHLEMAVPSMLELLRVPYTGSPPLALGLCQNKGLTKAILRTNGIPTPDYQVLSRFEDWKVEIGYPLFVKPLSEDGSIGITKESFIKNNVELKKRVGYIIERYRQLALVEKYIDGRELNIAILGDNKTQVLPISEIVFKFSHEPKIVDYTAKWFKDSEEYKNTIPICPAKLEQPIKDLVEKQAEQAYLALYCRDYARVDIRLDGEIPYVLEVNPNPDISPDGGFARSLKAAEIPYEEFIREILCSALQRKASLSAH